VSFCAVVYNNLSDVITRPGVYQVGFDAGDKMRGVNLLGEASISWSPQRVNIFRIDGMWPQAVVPVRESSCSCSADVHTAVEMHVVHA
jgi:hypothetical protein